jgi:hypothetical protein
VVFVQLLLACGSTGCAHTPDRSNLPPSDISIHRLIEITSFDQIVDRLVSRMGDEIIAKTDQLIASKTLNAAQLRIFEEGRLSMISVIQGEMSWSRLKPDVVDCFREFYTQKEVDALIQFYRSQPGAVLISRGSSAVFVFNPRNVDAWTKIRQTQGEDAFRAQIARDVDAVIAPREIDGILSFYNSDIGREIGVASDQARDRADQTDEC